MCVGRPSFSIMPASSVVVRHSDGPPVLLLNGRGAWSECTGVESQARRCVSCSGLPSISCFSCFQWQWLIAWLSFAMFVYHQLSLPSSQGQCQTSSCASSTDPCTLASIRLGFDFQMQVRYKDGLEQSTLKHTSYMSGPSDLCRCDQCFHTHWFGSVQYFDIWYFILPFDP